MIFTLFKRRRPVDYLGRCPVIRPPQKIQTMLENIEYKIKIKIKPAGRLLSHVRSAPTAVPFPPTGGGESASHLSVSSACCSRSPGSQRSCRTPNVLLKNTSWPCRNWKCINTRHTHTSRSRLSGERKQHYRRANKEMRFWFDEYRRSVCYFLSSRFSNCWASTWNRRQKKKKKIWDYNTSRRRRDIVCRCLSAFMLLIPWYQATRPIYPILDAFVARDPPKEPIDQPPTADNFHSIH